MVALQFKPQFVEPVKSGEKRQTVRDKTSAFTGCELQFYSGWRTKKVKSIGKAMCQRVERITLMEKAVQPHGNTLLMGEHLQHFAKADGFKNYAEMWAFFKDRADENGEYKGYLIKW